MRKFNWQAALLALWPYSGVLLLEVMRRYTSWTPVPILVWMAGLLITCVLNIIHSLRMKECSALAGMLAKLVLIPYYAITFVYGLLLFAAPPVVIIILLLNSLLLLATSTYALRSAYLDWRVKKLSTAWMIILTITQLTFILDIPGSIALYTYQKRRSR